MIEYKICPHKLKTMQEVQLLSNIVIHQQRAFKTLLLHFRKKVSE